MCDDHEMTHEFEFVNMFASTQTLLNGCYTILTRKKQVLLIKKTREKTIHMIGLKYFVTIAKFAFKVCKFAANIKELLYVHFFSRALRHLIFML